ncbi:MAG: hypothetical protein JWM34_4673 [Ilumatobacteraceae bacterium]|nr:hypothetical protein [Ilumatobacteraceae bacterium]
MATRRRASYFSPFAMGRRNGLYKGLLGGDRRWLVIGGALWGARFLRKALGKNEEVVTIEKMEPGQWMSLRTISPKQQKAEKQAAKLARSTSKKRPVVSS